MHSQTHVWETLAHEVEPDQLVNKIVEADNQDDKEAVESYLCGKNNLRYASSS